MINPLPDTHILVPVQILGDDQPQMALVRKEATVQALVRSTLQEFTKEKELDENRDYALYLRDQLLDPNAMVGNLDLGEDETLVLGYEALPRASGAGADPGAAAAVQRVELQEVKSGRRFVVERFPALIGRSDASGRESVAVDLSEFESFGERTVSRRHARLIEADNKLFVESPNPNNVARVGDRRVEAGERVPLRDGDVLRLGEVRLTVRLHG